MKCLTKFLSKDIANGITEFAVGSRKHGSAEGSPSFRISLVVTPTMSAPRLIASDLSLDTIEFILTFV
jgi:hypothetical protein